MLTFPLYKSAPLSVKRCKFLGFVMAPQTKKQYHQLLSTITCPFHSSILNCLSWHYQAHKTTNLSFVHYCEIQSHLPCALKLPFLFHLSCTETPFPDHSLLRSPIINLCKSFFGSQIYPRHSSIVNLAFSIYLAPKLPFLTTPSSDRPLSPFAILSFAFKSILVIRPLFA